MGEQSAPQGCSETSLRLQDRRQSLGQEDFSGHWENCIFVSSLKQGVGWAFEEKAARDWAGQPAAWRRRRRWQACLSSLLPFHSNPLPLNCCLPISLLMD